MSPKKPFAVKYRPRKLSQVVGQEVAVGAIEGFLKSKRIPNTILINGPFGSGKTTLARIIGLHLNCEVSMVEPCMKCNSCRAMKDVIAGKSDSHPDFLEVDAATYRGIDDMRILQKRAELAPLNNRKIIVLDECQEITSQGWKANLKTLEHPPGKALFILCTTDIDKLPKTIISRSFRVNLSKVDESGIATLLKRVAKKEKVDVPKSVVRQVSALCGGHPRDALQLFENVVNFIESTGASPKDLEKHFPRLFAQSSVYKTYMSVQTWWSAIWKGNPKDAFVAIDSTDNLLFFMDQALLVWSNIVRKWLDPALVDKTKMWGLKNTVFPPAKKALKHQKDFAKIYDTLLKHQSMLRNFNGEPRYVVESATMEIVALVLNWR